MMADIQHTQTHPKFTLSDKAARQKPLDLIQSVKKSAMYHWENLLPACGINIPAKDKHGSCPICGGTGGKIRYRTFAIPERKGAAMPQSAIA
ncbi:hypothetical protein [Xenorhabdus szentirmaii]|uniref:hypothetical protein n=1 Tax=Xenorhabdus szentirmaii TaxID=290112 RepID=UPI0019ACA96B|nr:hypothetical protein [Xenorhabdus sp. 38]MBD2782834.1 hypothetical protein [Xenorhabdus sp. 38]